MGKREGNPLPMSGKVRESGFQCLENLVPMVGESREGPREGHTDVGRKARGKFPEKCALDTEKIQKNVHWIPKKYRKMCIVFLKIAEKCA